MIFSLILSCKHVALTILSFNFQNMKLLFSITTFLTIISLTLAEENESEKKIEKILRVQLEEDDSKVVTMTDGELLVTYVFNFKSDIVDCNVNRRRKVSLGMLYYDVSKKCYKKLFFSLLFFYYICTYFC